MLIQRDRKTLSPLSNNPYLFKDESHSPKDHPKVGWNWPIGSGGGDFQLSAMDFPYFVIISPGKKRLTLDVNKLEDKLYTSFINIRNFFIISSWKRVCPFIWRKLESHFKQECLCQVWLKTFLWFCRKQNVKSWQTAGDQKCSLSWKLQWADKMVR